MTNRLLLRGALGLLCAAPFVYAASPWVEETFRASDLQGLGKLFANYMKARNENEGLGKAEEALSKEVDRHAKRLKKSPLAYPGEMGKALWLSYEYEKNQKVRKGKVDPVEQPAYFDAKAKLSYAIWTPAKYEPKKESYPLLLCIPDAGEKPTDHITEKWIDPKIRESAILVAVQMPADTKAWLTSAPPTVESGTGNLLSTLATVSRSYAIDFDRVYLVGRGAGVEAALTFASRYLDRFAGVIGRSGDAPADLAAENLQNQAIFFAGAGTHATALTERLKKLGYENVVQRKDDAGEADIWSWIQTHPRLTNPTEIVLYPGDPAPQQAAWLKIEPTDATGTVYIKAKIDKATNTVTVEGEGIKTYFLFFNDVLLDLDREVKVVSNGQEVKRTYTRNLTRMLDFICSARSDPGRIYVNSERFDLPPKPKVLDKDKSGGDPK